VLFIVVSQFVEGIKGDDKHVLIRNRYDFKIISILRLIELTWPDDDLKPMDECMRIIDQEIAGGN
jgi:hypothetical protein